MRPLENAILLVLLFALAWSFLPPRRQARAILYLPFLALALIGVHAFVEGVRWQMVPAYGLALALSAISLNKLLRPKVPLAEDTKTPKRWLRLLAVLGALVLFLVISQLPSVLPVFSLPDPGGPYQVGTVSFILQDTSRPEVFSADPNDTREIPVQVWYPAEPSGGEARANYWLDERQMPAVLAGQLGLPGFSLNYLNLVKTHAFLDAPMAAAQLEYPLVVFSHGYRLGYLQQNTSVMESLASHGYVVFSLAHPYEALGVRLSDGSFVPYADQYEQQFYNDRDFQLRSLDIWSKDVTFLLDALQNIDQGQVLPQFAGRLDLERIGLAGMSFGGSAITRVCLGDSRCKAGLAMDSPQYEPALSTPLQVPFLFMSAEPTEYDSRQVYEQDKALAYSMSVLGADHHDFSDLTLVSPLASALGYMGPINGGQMEGILDAYSLAFFNSSLKGLDSALLHGPAADYPEVSIESHPGTTP